MLAVVGASSPTLVAAIIAACGAVIAAVITGYALLRAQSYKQLLQDVARIVEALLEKQLAAERRGPAIARYVEETMRRVITELLGTNARGHNRRWYDR